MYFVDEREGGWAVIDAAGMQCSDAFDKATAEKICERMEENDQIEKDEQDYDPYL